MRVHSRIIANCNALYALCVVFMPDGHYVAVVAGLKAIHIYNVNTKAFVRAIHYHLNYIWSLAVTSDGQHLVSASNEKTARVCLLENGKEVRTLQHQGFVYGVALSLDNQFIVTSTGHPDNAVYVWHMADGCLQRQMRGHTGIVWSVAVSPDGLCVVSGSEDRTVRVWLLADGALQRKIEHPNRVFSVAVTPDSQRVVTGCGDSVVRLFLLATGALVRELRGHTNGVWRVAVSESGRHVVSVSEDKTVRVWSLADARTPLVLTGHTDIVRSVAFHPNGKQVASASDDGTVRLWTICEWSDRDHQLFSQEFKALVFYLICLKTRLDNVCKREKNNFLLPRLPMAVWLQVFAFLSHL